MGDDLRRPSASHFAFGLRTPRLGAFRAIATGVGRWLSQRYTVRLSDPSTYSPVELRTAGDERVTAFAKDLSSAGHETYLLVNDPDRTRYLGLELQRGQAHSGAAEELPGSQAQEQERHQEPDEGQGVAQAARNPPVRCRQRRTGHSFANLHCHCLNHAESPPAKASMSELEVWSVAEMSSQSRLAPLVVAANSRPPVTPRSSRN